MQETSRLTVNQDEPAPYTIRIKGLLPERWATWFDGLIPTVETNGETLLTGVVIDQAALYGLLRKVRDLGMPLISVMRIEPEQANTADSSCE